MARKIWQISSSQCISQIHFQCICEYWWEKFWQLTICQICHFFPCQIFPVYSNQKAFTTDIYLLYIDDAALQWQSLVRYLGVYFIVPPQGQRKVVKSGGANWFTRNYFCGKKWKSYVVLSRSGGGTAPPFPPSMFCFILD